jgi:hypothetical protein
VFIASITLQKHLCQGQMITNKKQKSNIQMKLNCHNCMGCYTEQTGCNCKGRYNEHTHAIYNNNEKSGYLQHIWHTCSALKNTFDILELYIKDHICGAVSWIISLLVSYLVYCHLLTDTFPLYFSIYRMSVFLKLHVLANM